MMGLFGKKKTPEEILAKGRALYEQGEYGKASLVLLKASGKMHGKVDYWLGRSYLAMDAKKGKSPSKTAKQYLEFAARNGHADAAQLLASEFGVQDYLPKVAVPQPEPKPAPKAETPTPAEKPAPQPKPEPKQEPAPEVKAPESKPKPAPALAQEAAQYFREAAAAQKAGDSAKCLALCEKAAELGHAKAQFNCGMMYDSGVGAAVDKAKALYWFEKAAEQGDTNAQYNCGLMYATGEGTAEDPEKAEAYFEKAAQSEDSDVREEARGQLMKLYLTAANQGSMEAQYKLGCIYYDAETYGFALLYFEDAANQGHVEAQFMTGFLYETGLESDRDPEKALYWYKKAAENGYDFGKILFLSDLQFLASTPLEQLYEKGKKIYEDGDCAPEWAKVALKYMEYAAEQGYVKAQYECGCMYRTIGCYSHKEFPKALYWLEKASEQGSGDASYACGEIYEDAYGIYHMKDLSQAKLWYKKAAKQGNAEAKAALKRI